MTYYTLKMEVLLTFFVHVLDTLLTFYFLDHFLDSL